MEIFWAVFQGDVFTEGKEETPKVENNFWGFFFLCIDVWLSEIDE